MSDDEFGEWMNDIYPEYAAGENEASPESYFVDAMLRMEALAPADYTNPFDFDGKVMTDLYEAYKGRDGAAESITDEILSLFSLANDKTGKVKALTQEIAEAETRVRELEAETKRNATVMKRLAEESRLTPGIRISPAKLGAKVKEIADEYGSLKKLPQIREAMAAAREYLYGTKREDLRLAELYQRVNKAAQLIVNSSEVQRRGL
jgi:hypothetical protein